ncbi:outer membrane protein assembly factor BamC [Motiliproteus sp. SC1-56]|uniref:outer membrane protein assembly factor BamC n=1 Tax=Motiliproteus sp. SC1-56 TaxID=2799565 RepID=UPI001A8C0A49|nr:outer membrane protein assembly factor BamC [Motiliproteus sp. SC1-56]
MKTLSVVALAGLMLAGCASVNDVLPGGDEWAIRDRSQDYQQARTLARIEVPAHLDAEAIEDILVVPEVSEVATATGRDFEVPRPSFFYAEAGNEVVNLAREGQEKLILVDEPQEVVWEKVQGFWRYNEVDIALMDPELGIMETAWIAGREEAPGFFTTLLKRATFQEVEPPYQDKLRLVLTRPADAGQTAIRLQHARLPADTESVDWSRQAEDLSYKSEIMYELLHYLSKSSADTSARGLARRQQGTSPALLGRDSRGEPVLKLSADIDVAWSQLEQAMTRAELDVGSADRALGKYYITYTTATAFDAEEEGGFWGFLSWLHGDREDITISDSVLSSAFGIEPDEKARIRYSRNEPSPDEPVALEEQEGYKIYLGERVIYVFGSDKSGFEKNEATGKLEHTGQYQVKLNRQRSGVYVSVLTDGAEPAPDTVAEEILWEIKENMPAG